MIRVANKKYYFGEGYYIGRPSILGNPYPTKKSKFSDIIYSTEESLNLYRRWLWLQIKNNNEKVLSELQKLTKMEDVVLICWCVNKIGQGKCHGFIIKDCLEWIKEKNIQV